MNQYPHLVAQLTANLKGAEKTIVEVLCHQMYKEGYKTGERHGKFMEVRK